LVILCGPRAVGPCDRSSCVVCVLCTVTGSTDDLRMLVEFVRVINSNIRDLQLEIRKAADEFTGEHYYVLVCTTNYYYCHYYYVL